MLRREMQHFRLRFLSLCIKMERTVLEQNSHPVLPDETAIDAENLFRDFMASVNQDRQRQRQRAARDS